MSDLTDVLERADRAARRVPLPYDGFERLMRRRDRKRRNQRIAAAALAFAIAIAAIAGLIRAFSGAQQQIPVGPPKITVSNLSTLKIDWRVQAAGAGNRPIVAGGVVYETPDTWQSKHPKGTLEAIPTSCATTGGTCQPRWTASTKGLLATPTVVDGVVYVGGSRHAYAFPTSCAQGGATCEPMWKARIPGFGTNPDTPPVVVGDVVYFPSHDGGVYAFKTTCGAGGSTCTPFRTYITGGYPISRMTLADGILYAGAEVGSDAKGSGRLYAFVASCGSSTCSPLWVSRFPRAIFGLAVANGVLVVGTYGSVSGYEPTCANPGGCKPLWTGKIQGPAIGMVVVGGTIYLQDQASGVYAFPVVCGTADARCRPLWTATGFYSAGLSSAPPAVANGLVYIGGTDGKLYVFAASCSGPCEPLRTIDTAGGNRDWIYLNATDDMIFTAGGHSLVGFGLPTVSPGA